MVYPQVVSMVAGLVDQMGEMMVQKKAEHLVDEQVGLTEFATVEQ